MFVYLCAFRKSLVNTPAARPNFVSFALLITFYRSI